MGIWWKSIKCSFLSSPALHADRRIDIQFCKNLFFEFRAPQNVYFYKILKDLFDYYSFSTVV